MVSAGDNERLPDDDKDEGDSLQGVEDLAKNDKGKEVMKKEAVDRIRKGVKLKYKSKTVEKYMASKEKGKVEQKTKKPNIKQDTDTEKSIKSLLTQGLTNSGPFTIGNKLKKKIKKK